MNILMGDNLPEPEDKYDELDDILCSGDLSKAIELATKFEFLLTVKNDVYTKIQVTENSSLINEYYITEG